MKFKNYRQREKNSNSLITITMFHPGHDSYFKSRKSSEFQKEWLTGNATLSGWILNRKFNFREVESKANLTPAKLKELEEKRKEMYTWLVEFRTEEVTSTLFKWVLETAPKSALKFAESELEIINQLINGALDNEAINKQKSDYNFSKSTNFKELHKKNTSKKFKHPYDIHSEDIQIDYDCLMGYKGYLEAYIQDEIYEEYGEKVGEFSSKNIFKELYDLRRNLIIKYHQHESDDGYYYDILSVAGCKTPFDFKQKMLLVTNNGFSDFVKISQYRPVNCPTDLSELLIFEILKLKEIVIDDSYNYEAQEIYKAEPKKSEEGQDGISSGTDEYHINGEREIKYEKGHFKKFSGAKFEGNNDIEIVFNDSRMTFIQQLIPKFIEQWLIGIDEIARKIEQFNNSMLFMKLTNVPMQTKIYPTEDLCNRLAKLEIFPSTLESVFATRTNLTAGKLLSNVLKLNPGMSTGSQFYIECKSGQFYTFLIILEKYFDLDLRALEATKCFVIKDKDFDAKSYKTFKSRYNNKKMKHNITSIPALESLLEKQKM